MTPLAAARLKQVQFVLNENILASNRDAMKMLAQRGDSAEAIAWLEGKASYFQAIRGLAKNDPQLAAKRKDAVAQRWGEARLQRTTAAAANLIPPSAVNDMYDWFRTASVSLDDGLMRGLCAALITFGNRDKDDNGQKCLRVLTRLFEACEDGSPAIPVLAKLGYGMAHFYGTEEDEKHWMAAVQANI